MMNVYQTQAKTKSFNKTDMLAKGLLKSRVDHRHFNTVFLQIKAYGQWSAEKLTDKFYLTPGVRNRKFYLAPGMRNRKIYLHQMTVTNIFIWQSKG